MQASLPLSAYTLPLWSQRTFAAVFSLLSFIALLFLYTRNNTQPTVYHPDEHGKGEQVLYDERNWHHPTMLLDATALAVQKFNVEEDVDKVVIAGRWVSATFSALAVVFLSFIGYVEAGLLGMIIAAVICGFCPAIQVHAHYFKEDSALILGLAMFLLGTRLMFHRFKHRIPDLLAVILLGIACAVATSGKYVGAFTILPAFLLVFGFQRRYFTDLLLRPVLFLVALASALYLLNYRALQEWEDMWNTLSNSADQPTRAAIGGAMLPLPNSYFLKVTLDVIPIEIWLLAFAAVVILALTRRPTTPWHYVLIVFIILTEGALACTRQGFGRYALPAVVMIYVLAALGLMWIVTLAPRRGLSVLTKTRILSALPFLPIIFFLLGLYRAADTNKQFTNDSRDRLKTWLNQNLKPTDRVLAENYAGFAVGMSNPDSTYDLDNNVSIELSRFIPNRGSLDDLKAEGFKYVVMSEFAYDRYFNWAPSNTPEGADVADTRQAYESIMTQAKLVWHAKPTHNLHALTNPEIRVYKISD